MAGTGDAEKSSTENANFLEEWKHAREVLKTFDTQLDSIRKVGFTFITALLAAEVILLPEKLQNYPLVKFAVFLVTLILILGLYFLDKNYSLIMEAANSRAIVIERRLNLELSEIITDRFRTGHLDWHIGMVYGIFMVGLCLLGTATISSVPLAGLLWVIGIVVIIEIARRQLTYVNGMEDWTIFPLRCNVGDRVEITVTNLDTREKPKAIAFKPGDRMWTIRSLEDTYTFPKEAGPKGLEIHDNYTWFWNTGGDAGGALPGIYELVPRDRSKGLRRKIILGHVPGNKSGTLESRSIQQGGLGSNRGM